MDTNESSNDVIVEETQVQQTGDSVTVGNQEPEKVEQPVDTQVLDESTQTVDDRPQKNVDSEWMRKYNNLRTEFEQVQTKIPEIIQQSVQKAIGETKQERVYGVDDIPQIRAYAEENPEYAVWAQSEIDRINREEAANIVRQELSQREKEARDAEIRRTAEAEVLSDAKYSEAFVTLPNGQKTWNPDSQLAKLIGQYMLDDRIKNQPDGLLIASKLARADMIDSKSKQIDSLKRENINLQKKTLSEGGGVGIEQKSSFDVAKQRLRQTGSDSDAKAAIKEFLKRRKGV